MRADTHVLPDRAREPLLVQFKVAQFNGGREFRAGKCVGITRKNASPLMKKATNEALKSQIDAFQQHSSAAYISSGTTRRFSPACYFKITAFFITVGSKTIKWTESEFNRSFVAYQLLVPKLRLSDDNEIVLDFAPDCMCARFFMRMCRFSLLFNVHSRV